MLDFLFPVLFSPLSWIIGGSSAGDGSSSNSDETPPGVTKINDSLYELYAPEGVPEVDIIFFHGLQVSDYRDAYWKTWSSDGTTSTLWPRTLLAEQSLRNARILAVSYDSSARKSLRSGHGNFYIIAESLVNDVIESAAASVGQGQRPVVLVGHSLGGLVIKSFILMAWERRNEYDPNDHQENSRIATIDSFLQNFRGVFYYATPHQGSKLADIASKLPGNSEVLIFLKTLSKDTARLNEKFRRWRARHRKRASTMGEGLATRLGRIWGGEIVTEASARNDTDHFYTAASDDHISICKPQNLISNSFQRLRDFVTENVSALTVEPADISTKESLR